MKLSNALKRYAKQDLKIARENGKMAITQTKLGLLTVRFSKGLFFIAAQNGQAWHALAEKEAIAIIVKTYDVVTE